MSRIRTLTTALAILALGAITAGCADRSRFADNDRPVVRTAALDEESDVDDVAETSWDRCDGPCRYAEARRVCATTPVLVGAQLQHAFARLMQFRGDRRAFRLDLAQRCTGGVRYASGYGRPQYPADRVLDSLGPEGRVHGKIRSTKELSEAQRKCGFMATVRGRHGFVVSQRCMAKDRPETDEK